jgi:hypothetical protein
MQMADGRRRMADGGQWMDDDLLFAVCSNGHFERLDGIFGQLSIVTVISAP